MKKIKDIFYYAIAFAFMILIFEPLIYWVLNPHLSKMQVMIDSWWVYVGLFLCSVFLISK